MIPSIRNELANEFWLQPRYVVLGSGALLKTQNDILSSTEASRNGRKGLKPTSSKPSLVDVSETEPDKLHISIYKQKVRIWMPFVNSARAISNFVNRAIGNSLHSIRYLPSRPARFGPFNTENRDHPSQP
jgi:hypothetical protein